MIGLTLLVLTFGFLVVRDEGLLAECKRQLADERTHGAYLSVEEGVRNHMEGRFVSSNLLEKLMRQGGHTDTKHSGYRAASDTAILIIYVDLGGCLSCVEQALGLLESDPRSLNGVPFLEVVYVSPDSLVEIAKYARLHRLHHRFLQDQGKSLRAELGIKDEKIVMLLIQNGVVVYAHHVGFGVVEADRQFLRRSYALIEARHK